MLGRILFSAKLHRLASFARNVGWVVGVTAAIVIAAYVYLLGLFNQHSGAFVKSRSDANRRLVLTGEDGAALYIVSAL